MDVVDDQRLSDLKSAINESGKLAQGVCLFYFSLGIYFFFTAAGTTHQQLLSGASVSVPVFNVSMPLFVFYLSSPILFCVVHLFLLVQLSNLVHLFVDFHVALKGLNLRSKQIEQRHVLLPFFFTMLLVLDKRSRVFTRLSVGFLVAFAIVLFPLGVLFVIQLMFLPYHDHIVTLYHQIVLGGDALIAGAVSLWMIAKTIPAAAYDLQTSKTRFGIYSAIFPVYLVIFVSVMLYQSWEVAVIPKYDSKIMDVNYLDALGMRSITLPNGVSFAADIRNGGVGLDLSGRDLRGARVWDADFSGAQLEHAILTSAILSRANFTGAHLFDADLQGALLGDAQFNGASLQGAKLSGAYLPAAEFIGANVGAAVFDGADLSNANFTAAAAYRTSFRGAFLDRSLFSAATVVQAHFDGASLRDADLRAVIMAWSSAPPGSRRVMPPIRFNQNPQLMNSAYFVGADLRGSLLGQADLEYGDFRLADMRGVNIAPMPEERWKAIAGDINANVFDDRRFHLAMQQEARLNVEYARNQKGGMPTSDAVAGGFTDMSAAAVPSEAEYSRSLAELLLKQGCSSEWAGWGLLNRMQHTSQKDGSRAQYILSQAIQADCEPLARYRSDFSRLMEKK